MPSKKPVKEKSAALVMCARPSERKEILRAMNEERLRTPFDVVRAMAKRSDLVDGKKFDAPRVRA